MEDIDIRALNEKINLIQNVKNSKAYYQVMNDLRIVVVFVSMFLVKVNINFKLRQAYWIPSNLECFTIENTKLHSSTFPVSVWYSDRSPQLSPDFFSTMREYLNLKLYRLGDLHCNLSLN